MACKRPFPHGLTRLENFSTTNLEFPKQQSPRPDSLLQKKSDKQKKKYIHLEVHAIGNVSNAAEKLAEYRYAALHLENHIKLSHNFLDALNEIKPILQEIKPQLPTLSSRLGDATVFYARVLAVKAALKMLGKRPQPAGSDNPSVLGNLSDVDYLYNFPLIIASSPEMTAFISLAEAIFLQGIDRARCQ